MDISYGAGNDTSLNPNLHLMQAGPAGGDITYSHGFRALCLCTCMEACKKTLEQRRFLHACHIQLCPNLIGIMMHAASCGAPLHQSFTLCPVRSLKLYRYVTNARTACRAQQQDMHVLAIPGSLRKASTNNGLIRAAVKLAPQGMQIDIADISKMPLYNDDLWQSGVPRSVTAFRDQIQAADALLFSVPEYNYSLPGPLKNAIDWASHPNVFAGKPGTMMGESSDLCSSSTWLATSAWDAHDTDKA